MHGTVSLVHVVRTMAAPTHRAPASSRTRTNMSDGIDSPAVRAPDFPDTLDWLHTSGRRLTLGDFRGKVLLLDFWTYG